MTVLSFAEVGYEAVSNLLASEIPYSDELKKGIYIIMSSITSTSHKVLAVAQILREGDAKVVKGKIHSCTDSALSLLQKIKSYAEQHTIKVQITAERTNERLYKEANYYIEEKTTQQICAWTTAPAPRLVDSSRHERSLFLLCDTSDIRIGANWDIQLLEKVFQKSSFVKVYHTRDISSSDLENNIKMAQADHEKIIIYYSGHGYDEGDGLPSFYVKEGKISYSRMFSQCDQAGFSLIIVGGDACLRDLTNNTSQKLLSPIEFTDFNCEVSYDKLWEGQHKVVFNSCSKGEISYGNIAKGGYFTNILVKAFRESISFLDALNTTKKQIEGKIEMTVQIKNLAK